MNMHWGAKQISQGTQFAQSRVRQPSTEIELGALFALHIAYCGWQWIRWTYSARWQARAFLFCHPGCSPQGVHHFSLAARSFLGVQCSAELGRARPKLRFQFEGLGASPGQRASTTFFFGPSRPGSNSEPAPLELQVAVSVSFGFSRAFLCFEGKGNTWSDVAFAMPSAGVT